MAGSVVVHAYLREAHTEADLHSVANGRVERVTFRPSSGV
jgi:hypothetical protein